MKNSVLIIIFVVIFVVGGGALFLSQQSNKDAMKQDMSMTGDKDAMMDQNATPTYTEDSTMKKDTMMVSGQYIQYSKESLDKAKDKKRVLFFFANWCPICKPADEDFTKNVSKIPEDVVLIRVNYNDSETDQAEKDLAKKYGVTYQHAFVQIDADGKEVTKWNGGQVEELLSNIK